MPLFTYADSQFASSTAEATISIKLAEAKMTLRDLMLDHIFWSRNAVMSSINMNDPSFQIANQRAMENAKIIAKFGETYCGPEKAKQFLDLFTGHYTGVVDYVKAIITDNVYASQMAEKALYVNSENLGTFLSEDNQYIKKDEFMTAFNMHIQQHLEQIKFIKAKDYESEAKLWMEMKTHAYDMADYLVNAIAQKYPDKF
jgi:hypothetical protein